VLAAFETAADFFSSSQAILHQIISHILGDDVSPCRG
jgi:hypothetical protein